MIKLKAFCDKCKDEFENGGAIKMSFYGMVNGGISSENYNITKHFCQKCHRNFTDYINGAFDEKEA